MLEITVEAVDAHWRQRVLDKAVALQFGPAPFCDVAAGADQADDLTVGVRYGGSNKLRPHVMTGRVPHAEVRRLPNAGAENRLDPGRQERHVFGMNDVDDRC